MTTLDNRMILHVDYWDKRKRSKQRISFQISGFDDYKAIVKCLRKQGLKIKEISIEHRVEIKEQGK